MTQIIDRALVEQALEALERLQNAIYNIGGEHVTGLFVANAAADSAEKPMGTLRAALAQSPESETCTWHQDGDSDSGVYATSCGRYFTLRTARPRTTGCSGAATAARGWCRN
jgi:hypothetical protein